MRLLFALLVVMAITPDARSGGIEVLGQLAGSGMAEISGIAVSRRDHNVVWGINDSGNAPTLHAFAANGTQLGSVRVQNTRNFDWEDLASFELDNEPYLLVADTGDNFSRRAVSTLLIIAEPRASANGKFSGTARVISRILFRYEDGPRDCEAVAVDSEGQRIFLISKRDVPAAVYEIPLIFGPGRRGVVRARRVSSIAALPRPTISEALESPRLGLWRHQPTAMDIVGQRMALLTYQDLYLFRRTPGQSWSAVFSGQPSVLRLPELSQTESVAIIDDIVIVIAEGSGSPIMAVDISAY